ncbi:hypothetical protein CLOP_g9183 [Closterium sp. NIES-67]|nr:hypothetical protein CLOP_g9183 [Closterium sp. NIES-67]
METDDSILGSVSLNTLSAFDKANQNFLGKFDFAITPLRPQKRVLNAAAGGGDILSSVQPEISGPGNLNHSSSFNFNLVENNENNVKIPVSVNVSATPKFGPTPTPAMRKSRRSVARQSLPWNNAFLEDEGLLNDDELHGEFIDDGFIMERMTDLDWPEDPECATSKKASPRYPPSGSESAPIDSESVPADSESAPSAAESAPSGSESAPCGSEPAPSVSEFAPSGSRPAKILEPKSALKDRRVSVAWNEAFFNKNAESLLDLDDDDDDLAPQQQPPGSTRSPSGRPSSHDHALEPKDAPDAACSAPRAAADHQRMTSEQKIAAIVEKSNIVEAPKSATKEGQSRAREVRDSNCPAQHLGFHRRMRGRRREQGCPPLQAQRHPRVRAGPPGQRQRRQPQAQAGSTVWREHF